MSFENAYTSVEAPFSFVAVCYSVNEENIKEITLIQLSHLMTRNKTQVLEGAHPLPFIPLMIAPDMQTAQRAQQEFVNMINAIDRALEARAEQEAAQNNSKTDSAGMAFKDENLPEGVNPKGSLNDTQN